MERKRVKLSEIHPDPLNPRENARTVRLLRESFKEFGQCGDVVIDKKGKILCGHARYEAAKEEGVKELDVVVFVGSDREARAFALDDNFSAETNRPDTRTVLDILGRVDAEKQNALALGYDDIARKKLREKLDRSKPKSTNKTWNVIIDCVTEDEMTDRAEQLQDAGYRVQRKIS